MMRAVFPPKTGMQVLQQPGLILQIIKIKSHIEEEGIALVAFCAGILITERCGQLERAMCLNSRTQLIILMAETFCKELVTGFRSHKLQLWMQMVE